jgi:hypothetical protein
MCTEYDHSGNGSKSKFLLLVANLRRSVEEGAPGGRMRRTALIVSVLFCVTATLATRYANLYYAPATAQLHPAKHAGRRSRDPKWHFDQNATIWMALFERIVTPLDAAGLPLVNPDPFSSALSLGRSLSNRPPPSSQPLS